MINDPRIDDIKDLTAKLVDREPIEALAMVSTLAGDLISRMDIDDEQQAEIVTWLATTTISNANENRAYRATVAAARANGETPVFDLGEYRRTERPQGRV